VFEAFVLLLFAHNRPELKPSWAGMLESGCPWQHAQFCVVKAAEPQGAVHDESCLLVEWNDGLKFDVVVLWGTLAAEEKVAQHWIEAACGESW